MSSVRARWDAANRRGAILGPHGSGKTALLRAVHRALVEEHRPAVLLRIDRAVPDLSDLPIDTALLVDGAETLGYLGLGRFLRRARARAVLLTVHRACPLPTIHRTSVSAARVEQLIAALAPGDAMALLPHVPRLLHAHRGNLHEILRSLYHLVADR
ncbi:MAG TPA: hypothetical protein PKB10_01360 [Tepidisphaeraceae bacterium]|nr:hypothetical protein [Tepidisphaeraceae bacterium]